MLKTKLRVSYEAPVFHSVDGLSVDLVSFTERRRREAIAAATCLTEALVDHLNVGYENEAALLFCDFTVLQSLS